MTTNQQLKAHCEDVIANPQDHPDWVVDMARVALVSLEAVPVTYRDSHGCFVTKRKGEVLLLKGEMATPLYLEPPVAELKPVKMPQRYTTRIGTDLVSGTEVTRVVMIPDEHGQWLSIYDFEREFNRVRGIPS